MKKGNLIFIGLGLFDEKDISIKGINEIKNCDKVYAEFYTAKLTGTDIKKIEEIIGKKIKILSRTETEDGNIILNDAKDKKIAVLVFIHVFFRRFFVSLSLVQYLSGSSFLSIVFSTGGSVITLDSFFIILALILPVLGSKIYWLSE